MTEEGVNLEKYAGSQAEISLEYAFDSRRNRDAEKVRAMKQAAEQARGFIDKTRGRVAELAAEVGIPASTEWAKNTHIALWSTARSGLERKLSGKLEKGKVSEVLRTLDEIDPQDTCVFVDNAPEDYPAGILMVRESTGIPANSHVDLLRGKFISQEGNPERIVIGGQSFSKRTVRETIRGSRKRKPMYDLLGETPQVFIPLINPDSGRTQIAMAPLERLPNLENQLFSLKDIAVGVNSLASPDHGLQDRHDRIDRKDQQGHTILRRFVVIDGSGGSLKHIPNMTQATQDRLIAEKATFIAGKLRERVGLRSKDALESTHKAALYHKKNERNPAYATVAVVDIDQDQVEIATMGDVSVVAWSQEQKPHRRSSKTWSPENLSGPSNFELLIVPQNLAQAQKAAGLEGVAPTQHLDTVPEANQIYAAVGEMGKPNSVIFSKDELKNSRFLLIASDGAQPNGSLLDPETEYGKDVHGILSDLAKKTEKLSPEKAAEITNETAKAICERARQIPGETDDITVMIVDLKNWT